jgi:hypothetical protein
VLLHLQNTLGNVDMMLALTPVITMIVFTGSYMAMSGMAQDINAETNASKEIGNQAPGLNQQEAMAASDAMNGIGLNTSSVLNASVGARVTAAAQHAQAANSELALSSMDAYASKLQHADGRTGSSQTGVDGTQGSKVSGQHSEGVKTTESTGQDTQFMAKAAYNLALDKVLKSQGASKMTPEQIKAAAEKETASMLRDPASMASAFASAGKGGLANMARGFGTGLNAQAASKVAQQASHDMGDVLNSSSEGGVMKKLSGSLGIDSKDQKALEKNAQVQDALKTAKSANDQYQHAEELATQVSAATSGSVSQSLSGNALRSILSDAGQGSAYRGGGALLAGTSQSTQAMYAQKYQRALGMGYSPDQAAVTAYASTVNATQANSNGDGVEAMRALFAQPSAIGLNSSLSKVTPLLDSVANDVSTMKDKTALTPQEQSRADGLGAQSQTLPGEVDKGTAGAAKVQSSTPDATGNAGMGAATAFGNQAKTATTQAFTPKVTESAYQQAIDKNPDLSQAASNTQTPLAKFAQMEAHNPNGALAGLIVANGVGGFLGNLGQALENRALVGKAREGLGKGGSEPEGGKAPSGSPDDKPPSPGASDGSTGDAKGSPPSDGPDGKPTSAETPRQLTPEEVNQSKSTLQARVNAGETVASPISTPETAQARQEAARINARSAMGETVGSALPDAEGAAARQAEARAGVRFASEGAAKVAMEKAMTDAGARLVEKAPIATAVAEVAASTRTPVGTLVGIAVEGGVVVMNADVAATVLETGTAMVSQYGAAGAAKIMGEVASSAVNEIASSAGTGAMQALDNVNSGLGLPPPPTP